ncbi:hypothetical protein ACFQ2B_08335 [Streptomyces stramineus]
MDPRTTTSFPHPHGAGQPDDAYTGGTTHGTRLRGWKRPLLAAGAIFVLAMGTVTAVELVSDKSADGGKGTTTITQLVGGKPEKKQEDQHTPAPDPGHSRDGGRESGEGEDGGPTPGPDASRPGSGTDGTDKPDPTPSAPSPKPSGDSTPSPKPNPSNPGPTPDSGKGGDDGKGSGGDAAAQGTGGGRTAPRRRRDRTRRPARSPRAAVRGGAPPLRGGVLNRRTG